MNNQAEGSPETKTRTRLLLAALLFVLLYPAAAAAQLDTDSDLVPDAFDNCSTTSNGPNQASNQVDTDLDGYGNACDADYNNSLSVNQIDFALFLPTLTDPGSLTDHDGNDIVTISDFALFLLQRQTTGLPGPSGLPCAGTVPCVP